MREGFGEGRSEGDWCRVEQMGRAWGKIDLEEDGGTVASGKMNTGAERIGGWDWLVQMTIKGYQR